MHLKCFDADVVDIPGAELAIQLLHTQLFQVLPQEVGDKSSKSHLNEKLPEFQDVVPGESGSALDDNSATSKQLGFYGCPGISFITQSSCNILYLLVRVGG